MDILFTLILGQQNPFSQNIDLVTVIEDDTDQEALQTDKIQDQIYSCYYCGMNQTLEDLRKHHRERHQEKKLMFKCEKCDLWFEYLKHLVVHQKIVNHEQLEDKFNFDGWNQGIYDPNQIIKISEDEQIIDLIKINENEEQQKGFLEEKMITNQPQYRRSARNAGKIPKSYNTDQNEQSEEDELKICYTSAKLKIYYGKPKAQREPLKRYSCGTQIQNQEFNDVQGKACYCKQCNPSKKESIAKKVQNKSTSKLNNQDQDETKKGNEMVNQTNDQGTNQQSELEQAVISTQANIKQSQHCDEAVRVNCPKCPDKFYSTIFNLKRHFKKEHKNELKYFDEYMEMKN